VTGSVNQNGEVQAIGGATYKIEGFFDVCKAKGLSGKQGVMIPRDNLQNLALRDEVTDAAKAGLFTIYSVSTIEGIEILTGVATGDVDEEGSCPDGTVPHLVEKRLQDMARKSRDFGKCSDKESDEDNNEETKD
jgi:predicted ATP-dependent protease